MHDEDEVRDSPPAVIAAVAAGTGPLPFLAVYATIFIVHGGFHHIIPPDITSSNTGELVAGLICLAIFIAALFGIIWLLNGTRRWPFVIVQLGLFAISIDFLVDPTKGGRVVSALVLVTTAAALVCAALPQTWQHVGQRTPGVLARLSGQRPARRQKMPAGSGATSDTTPISARGIGSD